MALFKLLDNEPCTSDIASEPIKTARYSGCFFQVSWTADGVTELAGTLYLQGSNDNENWYNLATFSEGPSGLGAGGTGEMFYPIYPRYIRLFFSRTAGGSVCRMSATANLGGV